jgi:hypothetical protein
MAAQRSTAASEHSPEQRNGGFDSSDAAPADVPAQPRKGRFARGERGAALVEMAMILPVIVLLLFGIIEMSWLFAQANDVRHGAREGARLAAVNWGDTSAIGSEVCDRMDLGDGTLVITFADGSAGVDDGARESVGRILVELTPNSLTGMFDGLMNGNTITSDIDFVLEQPITPEAYWWNDGDGGSYTCA